MAKEKELFGCCFINYANTLYAFSQKIAEGMNIFFALKNIY